MDWVLSIALSILGSIIAAVLWQMFLQNWFHNVTTGIQSKYYDKKIRSVNSLFVDVAKGNQGMAILKLWALSLMMISLVIGIATIIYSSDADAKYRL